MGLSVGRLIWARVEGGAYMRVKVMASETTAVTNTIRQKMRILT